MSDLYAVYRLGPGATAAQRQSSAAYLAAAVVALLSSFLGPQSTGLSVVGGVLLGLAAAAWWLPWRRFHPRATLVLALPALGFLGLAIAVYGPDPITAACFVLLFAWAGLHHPPRAVLLLAPPAFAANLVPTLVSGLSPAQALIRSLLVAVIMVLVGLVIADRVDRLEQAKTRLSRAEQWRTAVMLSLAHDIGAPLSAVRNTLELINDGQAALPPAERGGLTALALRQTERIQQLTTGLLEIERVAPDQVTLQAKELALQPLVYEAIEHAGVSGAVVRTEPQLWVRADPVRLAQILVNLLTNAREHGRPPIVVVTDRAGDYCEVTIRDHGEGMPAGLGAELFARFVGADQVPGSVGIGLWAARQLAIAHGGDLRYEPADPGARFVLSLPAVDPTPPGL